MQNARLVLAAAAIAVFAAGAQAAPSAESLSAGAGQSFGAVGFAGFHFTPMPQVAPQAAPGKGLPALVHPSQLELISQVSTAKAPTKELALAALHNKQQKASVVWTLSGKSVWISGAFDRTGGNAFVSILVDGDEAKFFNVKGLLDSPKSILIGGASYRITIKADIFNQLDSEIVLTNEANRKDKQSLTLADMLDAVKPAGESVALGADKYGVFYYDDVRIDGSVDKTKQVFAFIYTDAKGELSVYMVPAELVTAQVSIFKVHDNRPMGLQRAGDTLKIFDQP